MRSKFEIKAQKELEGDGWNVDYKIRPSRPNPHYNTDYWNLFDLMAHKDGLIRLISIKGTAGVPSKHRKAIEDFTVGQGVQKEIWMYRKLASDRRRFVPRIEVLK